MRYRFKNDNLRRGREGDEPGLPARTPANWRALGNRPPVSGDTSIKAVNARHPVTAGISYQRMSMEFWVPTHNVGVRYGSHHHRPGLLGNWTLGTPVARAS